MSASTLNSGLNPGLNMTGLDHEYDPASDTTFVTDRSALPLDRADRRSHLVFHRNPVRMLFSAGPWAALAYLAGYLVTGPVFFALALSVGITAYALSITWIGLPLLIGAALVVRGLAELERGRALLVGARIPSGYRRVGRPGLFAQIKERWSDPATLRDYVYLVLLFAPLLVLDTVAFTVFVAFLGMVTLPLWFWSIPSTFDGAGGTAHGVMIGYVPTPHTTFGDGGFGIWVGDLPSAIATAAVFALLMIPAAYVVVAAAKAHLGVVRALLAPYVDPLARAKRMLAEPGPLA